MAIEADGEGLFVCDTGIIVLVALGLMMDQDGDVSREVSPRVRRTSGTKFLSHVVNGLLGSTAFKALGSFGVESIV